jgi:hypothetical protein
MIVYVTLHTGSDSHPLLLIQQYFSISLCLETFLHLRVTWQFAKLNRVSDQIFCRYIIQYAPVIDATYTHIHDGYCQLRILSYWRRLQTKQCYNLAVKVSAFFYLMILQGKPFWLYWNSSLSCVNSDLIQTWIFQILKLAYFGLYTGKLADW